MRCLKSTAAGAAGCVSRSFNRLGVGVLCEVTAHGFLHKPHLHTHSFMSYPGLTWVNGIVYSDNDS